MTPGRRAAHAISGVASFAQTLGQMRGGSVKVAQLLSFIDLGLIPEAYRELYEAELGQLRDAVSPMPFWTVRAVLEREWRGPIEHRLASLSPRPHAASLGQVHCGVLHDGRAPRCPNQQRRQ